MSYCPAHNTLQLATPPQVRANRHLLYLYGLELSLSQCTIRKSGIHLVSKVCPTPRQQVALRLLLVQTVDFPSLDLF